MVEGDILSFVKGVDKTPFFMAYYKGNQERHMFTPEYMTITDELRWYKTRFGLYSTQRLVDGEWVAFLTGGTMEAVVTMSQCHLTWERTGEGLDCYVVNDGIVSGKL